MTKKKHLATNTQRRSKPTHEADRRRRLAVAVFALSGMAALIYEVAWTRELSLVFGSTVYAVSMMLTAFMSGLSLGAFLGGKWADESADLFALFGRLETGIAVFGILTIPLTRALPDIYLAVYGALKPTFGLFFVIQLLLSFLIMLAPTTLMGATFPVVSKINTVTIKEVGTEVGNVYSVNTLGSIAGSLAAGFLLIPLVGVKATVFIAAGINLVVAVAMMTVASRPTLRKWLVGGAAALVFAAGLGLAATENVFAAGFYRIGEFSSLDAYRAYRDSMTVLYAEDDVHGRVAVLQDTAGHLHLQNSGKIEGSTQPLDRQTTALLADLPIASADSPRNALIIGLGTGFTTLESLSHPVESVETVEISDAVVEASHYFVGDALDSDPRSTIVIDDARNHLLKNDTRYDVVSSEPSYPLSTHVSHLFTLEFYQLVRDHLTENGVFCQWVPRYLLLDEDTLMMMKTFTQVFPNTYVWGSNQGENEAVDLLLIGVNGDAELRPAAIQAQIASSSDVALDFGFFGGPNDIAQAVTDPSIPLNTDDRPLLEFRTPKNQIEFFRQGRRSL